eukprot:TRINITY_DN7233_c0_g1_i1.p1 TRINITY_DN7233_c0_g1~~TRINITY_DN7233_c0_g1_i1.p1  ORF type:complete len:594 (+),score=70.74 TRINITY_DN7233_c0_g1_i1:88-1869(+)
MLMRNLFPVLKVLIVGQMIFYMTPGLLLPQLFVEVQSMTSPADAPGVYSRMMSLQCVLGFVTPLLAQLWMDRREGRSCVFCAFPPANLPSQGVREVYIAVTFSAAASALAMTMGLSSPALLGICWAVLRMPPEALRSVRGKVIADLLRPQEQNEVSQLCTFAGLLGGAIGPFLAATLTNLGSGFRFSACLACVAQMSCCIGMYNFLLQDDSTGSATSATPWSWLPWRQSSLKEPLLGLPSLEWTAAAEGLDLAPDPENVTNWSWQVSSESTWVYCDEDLERELQQAISEGRKELETTRTNCQNNGGSWHYKISFQSASQGEQLNKDTGTRRGLRRTSLPAEWLVRTSSGMIAFDTSSAATVMTALYKGEACVQFERRGWNYEMSFPVGCEFLPCRHGYQEEKLLAPPVLGRTSGKSQEISDRAEGIEHEAHCAAPMTPAGKDMRVNLLRRHASVAAETNEDDAADCFFPREGVNRHSQMIGDRLLAPQEITLTRWFLRDTTHKSAFLRKRPTEDYSAQNLKAYVHGWVIKVTDADNDFSEVVGWDSQKNKYVQGFVRNKHMVPYLVTGSRWVVNDTREGAFGHAVMRSQPRPV